MKEITTKTVWRHQFERLLKKKLPNYAEKVLEIEIDRYTYGKLIASKTYHTLDIDKNLSPDFVTSCENMSMVESNTYDVILLFGVLEHCKDSSKAVNEIKRVMKENGKGFHYHPFYATNTFTPQ